METTKLYEDIKQVILSNGFTVTEQDGHDVFERVIEIQGPRQQVIINGKMMENPQQTRKVSIKIQSLGKGAMWDAGEEEVELQGFNIGDNDIWVESVDDFMFWIGPLFDKLP